MNTIEHNYSTWPFMYLKSRHWQAKFVAESSGKRWWSFRSLCAGTERGRWAQASCCRVWSCFFAFSGLVRCHPQAGRERALQELDIFSSPLKSPIEKSSIPGRELKASHVVIQTSPTSRQLTKPRRVGFKLNSIPLS